MDVADEEPTARIVADASGAAIAPRNGLRGDSRGCIARS
jgi:hypothetical protein